MRRLIPWAIAASLCFASPAQAGCRKWILKERPYYDPLIAEPRAATISITAVGWADAFPFAVTPGKRRVWDISLGKEIPIVGCASTELPDLDRGDWGLGLWVPVSFHMIEGFKDKSNPILNTDYRFSAMFKVQWGLTDNARLGGRIQIGHESTHVGDEFEIFARQTFGAQFERVNVSYEYWEYGISYEVNLGENDPHHLILRHGGIKLLKPEKGFYSESLLQIGGRMIPRSKRSYEPSVGVQWFYEKDLLPGYGPFVSADLRHRIVYDYNRASSSIPEDRQWSLNLLIGLRSTEERRLTPFLRLYHGVNPHGMFRTQKNFTLIGAGIHVSL